MPIAWGVNATKVYTTVWLVVLIASVIITLVYMLQSKWWIPVGYGFVAVIIPLVYVLLKLKPAVTPTDYRKLSNITKLVMFTGILSMLFYCIDI